jgi:CRP-like cAMP-binding protein
MNSAALSDDKVQRTFNWLARYVSMSDAADLAKVDVSEMLVTVAGEHRSILPVDRSGIRELPFRLKTLEPGQDIVHQGEHPDVAVFVLSGMLARYHTLSSGDRQYLSFHIAGDLPDVQSLFLKVMDHSVCAMNRATLALFPHDPLLRLLEKHPLICFAFWRLTLADAAIFRQAITNNSRTHMARLAHLFCEIYYRSRERGIATGNSCGLPLTQTELGQTLGMSHISVNRALQRLRKLKLVEFRAEVLTILSWPGLAQTAGFDPLYLHIAK